MEYDGVNPLKNGVRRCELPEAVGTGNPEPGSHNKTEGFLSSFSVAQSVVVRVGFPRT